MNKPATNKQSLDAELHEVLKRYWGFDAFRPLQRDAIDCALTKQDSVVVLPTGGGKSLCYQIPALLCPGVAVVVSPLISLMKDQVDSLKASGAPAECIHSGMTSIERREVDRAIRDGGVKLLYVSPERLVQQTFIDYIRAAGVSFVAIDEAHCISHWGHDFRPEYRQLRMLREAFPDAALHAFTATATPHVRDDIAQELALRAPKVIVGSFDRPNLTYRVFRRGALLDQVREVLDRHRGESGIIYCLSRKNVDALSDELRALGYKSMPYHAGMDDTSRKRNQEAFSRDETDIIVATIAFGMGIDKSNVRFVIHAGLPKSIEHYQQETGRAGRDGLASECCMFYSSSDFMMWKGLAEKAEGGASPVVMEKLRDMLQFASGMQCRRHTLLSYFGETYHKPKCDACDVCTSSMESHVDANRIARAIVACVTEIGEYAGPSYTTQVLAGSQEERIRKSRANQLQSYGALRTEPQATIRAWIEQLVGQGYLVKRGEYNILAPGPRVADDPEMNGALLGTVTASTNKPRKTVATAVDPIDIELFEELRVLRRSIADARGVAAFVILSDASLNDMARKRPFTPAAFRNIHGIGERKATDFGDEFVAAIKQFCDARGLGTNMFETDLPITPRQTNSNSQEIANRLFADRKSLEEVAELMRRAQSTVEGYLAKYIELKGISDPEPWASVETLERVREAAKDSDDGRLRPIFDALNGEVPYAQIRICLSCIRNGG